VNPVQNIAQYSIVIRGVPIALTLNVRFEVESEKQPRGAKFPVGIDVGLTICEVEDVMGKSVLMFEEVEVGSKAVVILVELALVVVKVRVLFDL